MPIQNIIFVLFIFLISYLWSIKIKRKFIAQSKILDGQQLELREINFKFNRLQALFANMVEGIISIDHENKVLFCNSKMFEILQINQVDITDKKINTLIGFERINQLVEEAKSSNEVISKEIKFRVEDQKRVLRTHTSRFKDENGSLSTTVVVHDISKIHQLEKMRTDFVANVSHEIKTPLTNIKGYTETLLDGGLDDKKNRRRFVSRIQSSSNRLLSLVQDILELAKLESGDRKIFIRPLHWGSIVEEVIKEHDEDIENKKMTINVFEDDSEMRVFGDLQSITQIFENLLTNALRYTPDGGNIKVYLQKLDSKGILIVEDNGVGISEKQLPRIFERFYLADKARSREVGGTGLGLSIVKHLVHSLNGEINVESEVGSGSRFTVILPLA